MSSVHDRVLSALGRSHPPALFIGELAAKVRSPGLEPALAELEANNSVLVSRYPAPDPHLECLDLRIVALVPQAGESSALEASAELWADWLRQFLANHRCQ
ncbi:MAG TPA: hypothetical protein VMW62_10805 [Chloroflexota bacterium]|nr:hypothetical protein [Chloroflexota bacterium]